MIVTILPFKVGEGRLGAITIAFILSLGIAIASAQDATASGKALFESKCTRCHGTDGTKGHWGAANLQTSRLSKGEVLKVINSGKGIMPRWGKKLSQPEIASIAEYIKTLRND